MNNVPKKAKEIILWFDQIIGNVVYIAINREQQATDFVKIDKDKLDVVKGLGRLNADDKGYTSYQKDGKNCRLHRYLVNCPQDKIVDHINHNPFDNRLCNLRICTPCENSRNQQLRIDSTTKLKNISINGNSYRVQIKVDGVRTFDKTTTSIDEAIAVRNQALQELHGEFASYS